jgi:hypothetical protein
MIEEPCFFDQSTRQLVPRVRILMPKNVHVISDLDSQDGRTTGDKIPMPSVGKDVVVGSRRERNEIKARLRDAMWEQTEGKHETMRPHRKDPEDPNSPVVWEKHTRVTEGYDMGEVHDVETNPEEANRPKNAFKEIVPGDTLEEAEKRLEAAVGPHEDPPKRRGRPKGSKDKKPRQRRAKRGT